MIYPLRAFPGTLEVTREFLLVHLNEPHPSLSTSVWNGGLQPVQWILNQKLTGFYERETDFPGGSIPSYLRLRLLSRGADPLRSNALLTNAVMEHFSTRYFHKGSLAVEIITTGGCEATACRAGSPAMYEEHDHHFVPVGTVNIICLIHGVLSPGALTRTLISITEGKTAAFQDAGVFDVNNGLSATGTATDGLTVASLSDGPVFTDSGTFSLLGQFLAQGAHDTVLSCLQRQTLFWNHDDSLRTPSPVSPSDYR